MDKYQKLAEEIVNHVGGSENISDLTHCVTRLRFHLKDDSLPNDEVLKKIEGVVTVIRSGGQYQVVIGNHVTEVYSEVTSFAKLNHGQSDPLAETVVKKKKPLDALIDIISGLFQPILGILLAAGMLKGLNTLLNVLGVYSLDSGTYTLINAMGDALFMFLPVFLGYTSANKFKVQPFIGILIGLAMCYPAIQLDALAGSKEPLYTLFSGTALSSPVYLDLFGIPLISMNYTSTVLPVIIVVYFASKVQRVLDKIVPDVVKFFMVPMVTVLVSLSLGFLIIGPVASYASELIAQGILVARDASPLLAGFLLGFLWQVILVFGLHWGLIPLYINNITTLGYDTIMASVFATSFSQMAIVLAIIIKTKDKNLKALGIPAAISALFGITEPVVYGITLPRKKLFIMSCIVSGVAGGFYGLYNLREFTFGGLGIFEFFTMIDPNDPGTANLIIAIIGVVFAMIISFILTFVMFKDETAEVETPKSGLNKRHVMSSPMSGEVISIKEVKDEAFSQEVLGRGIGIRPSTGELVAPFDGKVVTLFPTKHAVGLVSDEGMEVLIHIGFNTVRLKGKHFEAFVQEGDTVQKGQRLVTFNIEEIEKAGFSVETPMIVTNTDSYLEIIETQESSVNAGEVLLTGLL
ncbi:beta-glucoside-specific PTS transporter subunit IIABC [Paenibacillus odorifer]|uniref:beta-glucoside-specific PTS transporter subunit IIABC n=1 Tax=Paenibacillus odorifer TaxID=189426 RepID=UPI000BA052CF|nr:beta-glucoside-specific PTS transporter subunit IIABC [Paenibacillus odorifer]OZQ77368.1 PTS beta-glucoside transporter subunit IIABC [Paenibacillus odorifer]